MTRIPKRPNVPMKYRAAWYEARRISLLQEEERGGVTGVRECDSNSCSGHGTDQVNLTGSQNGEMHFIGFSSDEDNGYYPGDKVIVSVSKYVPNGQIPYGTIDANGRASYVPQRIIDSKTISLGETGGIVSLFLSKSQVTER